MGLFEEAKKMFTKAIPMLKEDGFTNEDLLYGFSYAKKILKKITFMPKDKRDIFADVLDSLNDDIKKGK